MKKFCTLFFAVACCSIVFGQIISVTDGTLADWDNVPSEYLFKTECASNASMDGLKSVQVYVDMTYINLLVEVNDEVVTNREWTPFHVFINSDNNAATGGYGDQWTDADTDLMLETAIFGDGMVIPYNPAVFKWWGPNGENGWQWTDPEVEGTAENGWGALVPEGSMPIGNAQMVDGKIEIQLDYTLIPMPFDETTFTLGFDIQQSWSSVGILPNASDAEDGSKVLAEKLRVYVHPQNSSMRPTIDGIQYKITSNAEPYTAEVLSSRNLDTNITEITIPETIVVDGITYSVTSIGNGVFYGCSSLTSVTIPNSVTSIGNYAFYGCSSLTSVTIPNSVTSIGDNAFYNCSSLTITNYTGDVASWCNIKFGYEANPIHYSHNFYINGEEITELVIPNSVTSIGDYAFSSCISLTSVSLPDGLTSIGDYAFEVCRSLTSITIPESVTSIGNSAFFNCSSLTSITIPNSITSIGRWAFAGCFSLTSITIPNSVKSIGEWAFAECSRLTSITIPNSVTSIQYRAFSSCISLTSVTIGNSVTSIGYQAFYNCSSLTSITIPNSVTSVGDYAFSRCSSLDTIYVEATTPPTIESNTFTNTPAPICYIPCGTKAAYEASDWAQYMGEFVEEGCVDSTMIITYTSTGGNIITPNNPNDYGANIISNTYENGVGTITFDGPVTSIGNSAFTGCDVLRSINIPNSVTSIGMRAFYHCSALTSATIGNGIESIGLDAFRSCSNITSITIPNSVTSIGNYAFRDCSSLDTIYLEATTPPTIENNTFTNTPASICYIPCGTKSAYEASAWAQYMGEFVEEGCIDSTMIITYTSTDGNIVTPYNAEAFGANIVSNTYENGVGTITFDGPVTSIGNSAFTGCRSLTSITIPNSVTSIGSYAFDYCRSLTSITIPNSVTSIGEEAFQYCSSLTSITIPNSVTSIRDYTFQSCSSLCSITIPNSITSIGRYTFSYCSSLTSIAIPNSVTSIGDSAFRSCTSLTSITIPNSVTSIGVSAFDDCSSMVKTYFTGDITDWCKIEFVNVSANPINNSHNLYLNDVEVKDLIIPEGVTSVGNCAFYSCSSLTSVTIPNSVTSIGAVAFMKCSSLTFVAIGDGVTTIGDNAFFNCSSLDTLYIEATTPPTIGNNLFYTPAPTCYIPCGTKATYETSDWAQYMSEFVEECEVDSTMIITYTSTDGNVVTPYNAEAFGANIVSNTYENGVGTITFDAPITSIGEDAFFWCLSLTSITIPKNVTSIGNYAFFNCSSLTSVTIPNSVTSIGNGVFSGCSFLASIIVEEGNTIYDSRGNCNAIIETTTNILIAGCQNTVVPNGVVSIGEDAFFWCLSLTSITIPKSVTSIGRNAFENCPSLTSITIPNAITSIGREAFLNCNALTSITIPDNVASIGDNTFKGCTFAKDSFINNSYLDAKTNNYWGAKIADKEISGLLIRNDTVIDCRQSVHYITIPNEITCIDESAFSACSYLKSITIPRNVMSIKKWAFAVCTSLDTIFVEATTPPILEESVFENIFHELVCVIPCGTLEAYEASDWAQQSVREFVEKCKCGDDLYWEYNDTQLSITGYGDMYDYDIEPQPWQQHRNKITQISLPEGMTSVGAVAFADCKYVTSVAIPATVEKIHDSAFEDCRMLSSLSFAEPSALTSIGNWAFYNCHKLQYITIPEGVTEIGEAAFFDCTYLSELTLPATMEYIADNGFGLCAKLKRINVSATTPPAVEARTFEDVDRSISVYVPDAAVNDYKAAPVWQEFNIVGKEGVSTSVDNVDTSTYGVEKLLRDGKLVIIRDGVEYNVMGQQL